MAILSPAPKLQFFDANGNPLVGGKLYSYTAGTTSPLATYTDSTNTSVNTNPIILDSRGEASVWLGASAYKLVLYSATDVLIWSVDNVTAASSDTVANLAASTGSSLIGYIQGGTGSVATTVQTKLRQSVNVKDFGAVGNGVANDIAAFQAAIAYALSSPYPEIYVPAGSYYFASSLQVSGASADRFTMFGDGRASDIWSDQAVSTIDLVGLSGNTFQYPMLKDLAIRNTNAAGTALRTRNTEFLRVVRCTLAGGLNGLIMSETAGETDIKPQIHECVFASSTTGLKGGDTRVADAVIRDNLFVDCTSAMIDIGFLDGGTIAGNKLFSNNGASNAVVGIRLKKPIYAVVEDNAFFELGGTALQLTSPRYSRFNNNQIVNVGQNAKAAALQVLDYDASTPGLDVQITGNTFKDVDGIGVYVFSAASIQTDYLIADNYFKNVGDGTVLYDAINLRNCSSFLVRSNTIRGDSATRHWLYLDASTGIQCDDNIYSSCVNTDVGRINSPTMVFKQSVRNNLDVTATTTLTYNDDTALCNATAGAITVNLPSAASCPGKIYRIGKTDASANAVTIDPTSTQTVDGAATLAITTRWQVVTLMADGSGTNWITVSI